jgi:single-strand DNA-binding protein
MKRLTVIGNLTSDAEVKNVGDRKAINFAVAVNEKYKDSNGEKKEKTTFFNCTIWRESNVAVAEFLTKGTKVFVEGSPELEIYKSKDGETKGSIKIIVGNLELIGGGSGRSNQSADDTTKTKKDEKDDLPF